MASAVVSTGGSWANLPEEIVQVLGTYLDAQCWAAARSTCKGWRNITANINLLEIDLERDAHRWMMVVTCVARLFPRLNSITLLIGNRITPAVFRDRVESLAITNIKLQDLEMRFIYLSHPKIGAQLEDLSAVTALRHLQSLRLAGGATPPVEFFVQLGQLRQLTALEVLPGVYGQMFEMDADLASANSQAVIGGDGGLCDSHLAAVAALTQLKALTVKVSPSDCTPRGLMFLAGSGILAHLERLALYDSEFPSDCLAACLREAGCLTALQLGLNNVDDLAPLAAMPKLKGMSLDTAFLPDLRELVYAAARGNIPRIGHGSITGLCLMDQVINSPLQLAALSQLSSLSELILINPLPERLPDHWDLEDQDEIPDPAAQQQQQPIVIDLACLSGLTALTLLQIDRGIVNSSDDPLAPWVSPLQLSFSAAAVKQLAAAWTALVTLDLSGFTTELLPEAAVVGFSSLRGLKNLSLMMLKDAGSSAAQGLEAAAQQQQQQQQQQNLMRRLGWWQLPASLTSLCLSHFDLSCGILVSSSSSSGSQGVAAAAAGASPTARISRQTTAKQSLVEQLKPNPQDSSPCSNANTSIPSACGSSACCLASPSGSHNLDHQQQQQQQQAQGSALGRVQSLLSPRLSPLRPLAGSKRLRESPETASPVISPAAAAAGGSSSNSSTSSSTSGYSGEESTVATVRGGVLPEHLTVCPCAARVVSHFSSLQSLWLEHCSLPRNFLPLVLPSLHSSLEALALLHVSGARSEDLRLVSGLTSLTSLRLIPSGYGLTGMSGLSALLPLRHLKRLNVRLGHLRQGDLAALPHLRSLFCISLAVPAGETLSQTPVALQQVLDIVRDRLPYCDVEVQRL